MDVTFRYGIGYCKNVECTNYLVPLHMCSPGPFDQCNRCGHILRTEVERGFASGPAEVIYQVRVEYNFCPQDERYHGLAIVTANVDAANKGVYTLFAPFYVTEGQALARAEALLEWFNREATNLEDENLSSASNTQILYLHEPRDQFLARLRIIESVWANSNLGILTK